MFAHQSRKDADSERSRRSDEISNDLRSADSVEHGLAHISISVEKDLLEPKQSEAELQSPRASKERTERIGELSKELEHQKELTEAVLSEIREPQGSAFKAAEQRLVEFYRPDPYDGTRIFALIEGHLLPTVVGVIPSILLGAISAEAGGISGAVFGASLGFCALVAGPAHQALKAIKESAPWTRLYKDTREISKQIEKAVEEFDLCAEDRAALYADRVKEIRNDCSKLEKQIAELRQAENEYIKFYKGDRKNRLENARIILGIKQGEKIPSPREEQERTERLWPE